MFIVSKIQKKNHIIRILFIKCIDLKFMQHEIRYIDDQLIIFCCITVISTSICN